jgi:NADH-ubiquinone oxidoreductase chain 5
MVFYYFTPTFIYSLKTSILGKYIYTFLNNKWHFDSIYNHYLVKPMFKWGHDVSYKILDRGLIEVFGPAGVQVSVKNSTQWLSSLQSGFVYNYAFTIFLGTTSFLILMSGALINIETCLIIIAFAAIVQTSLSKVL